MSPADHVPHEGGAVDTAVERIGRWTARRTTRRGFLGRLGRAGVLLAGGSTMATFLADAAEARVCGQSGTAPRCGTFDCNATWGWCWYASGCCAGGALKKICDCCAPHTPNPIGYCPSGTRVLCIVESCGADPRVQSKPVQRFATADPVRLSVDLSLARFPSGGVPMAVLGDAADPAAAAVAASVGSLVEGPVLLTGRGGLDPSVASELSRLGTEFVKVVGPALPAGVLDAVAARGIDVERIGGSASLSTLSAEVALWHRPLSGKRRAILVLASALPALAPAAAAANQLRLPLLVGDNPAVRRALAEPRAVRTTYVVSTDPGDAGWFPGGQAVSGGDTLALARAVADLAVGLRGGTVAPASLVARTSPATAAALAGVPATLLLHDPGSSAGARGWFILRRLQVDQVLVSGDTRVFPNDAMHDIQAAVNDFQTHNLRGGAGDGLPVIPQPPAERPIGRARV